MMPRCRTCRWWQTADAREGDQNIKNLEDVNDLLGLQDDPGVDVVHTVPLRLCCSPYLRRFEQPDANNGATLLDGEGYAAALLTGPDFGCVNHEEAP